ncbi:MAG TPA: type 4a pilus biogenesis protein PilO [Pyrinomonadaceae bacterium]|jgi:Tfp pilus assembly protein PilO
MNVKRNPNSLSGFGDSLVYESQKYGTLVTLLVMAVLSFGIGYLVYSPLVLDTYSISGWYESNLAYRQKIVQKEIENKKTENLLAGEEQFKARYDKIVGLYEEAKPLLPEETEISEVLGQVESAAQRNGVTLTGLSAVKESAKSARAEKLYEREIPALVTGSYPQIVRFFTDISRMPRILVVRDYSIISMKDNVSAGFTLIAYHAPPPGEKPAAQPKPAVSRNTEVQR